MKIWQLLIIGLAFGWLLSGNLVGAAGLKIQPLEYDAVLESGDRQRGVVDISNPTDRQVTVETSVQAVRQINNDGELEFYDDEAIERGVILDNRQIQLAAKSAYRLVFELDASKLPPGDSVAAIFAQTASDDGMLSSSARVGTLLFITNGTPTDRQTAISQVDINWLQTGGAVAGSYGLTNHADPNQSTGYRPDVTIGLAPFTTSSTTTGPLVFAGRSRSADFELPTNRVGLYKLTVATGDSRLSAWVFLVPTWSVLSGVGLLMIALTGLAAMRLRRRAVRRRSRSRRR